MDSTMKGQMDSVTKAGVWVLGWAGRSSSKGCLCALPNPSPHPPPLYSRVGVLSSFHSFDLDSSVPSGALTYFSVESQRHGGWWVFVTPLHPRLLRSSDLAGIWKGKHRVLDMLCLWSHPGARVEATALGAPAQRQPASLLMTLVKDRYQTSRSLGHCGVQLTLLFTG